jgi:predicted nucleic acid-binding protein
MIAVDSSVAIAAFASWHEWHEPARCALDDDDARLVAHCAVEVYSVLTRLPAPHRVPGRLVQEFLDLQFPGNHLTLPARDQRRLPRSFVELGLSGGAVYDALVALTAAHAGAPIVTCDRRAIPVYQRCGVEARLVG